MTYGMFGIVAIFLITRYLAPAVLKAFRQPEFGALSTPLQPVTATGVSAGTIPPSELDRHPNS
jgi:hypothetical protein